MIFKYECNLFYILSVLNKGLCLFCLENIILESSTRVCYINTSTVEYCWCDLVIWWQLPTGRKRNLGIGALWLTSSFPVYNKWMSLMEL